MGGFDYIPISWNTVIFKIRSIFATDERIIMSEIAFHYNALGNPGPLNRVSFLDTDQWAFPPNTTMKGHSQHSLIGLKNQAKFENDCVLTNGHRIKITQSNLMILVSFSSAEDVWFNDLNRYNTFSLQGTENPPFRFFWDTRYITWCVDSYASKKVKLQLQL